MNLVVILIGLCLFAFHSAICETTFALNNYVCSVTNGGFFTAQSKLVDQNETSYSVTVEFANFDSTYQTILSHTDFENVEKELCTYTYVVNNVLGVNVSPKIFSSLMTFVMKTQLDFYLVEYELLRQSKEVSKIYNIEDEDVEDDENDADIIEL